MNLEPINSWSADEALPSFLRCCHSVRWAEQMVLLRPFESREAILEAADSVWWNLTPADWLEAFAGHPKIGDRDALRAKFAATASWAAREQSGVDTAPEHLLEQLAEANVRYEQRFGYIFIVCATGKTGEEMLSLLNQRLPNDPEFEITVAAGEQAKITRIRLEKLTS
jgi:2-oxo-4-hydroxy-4-carboxy-5-ureidoimidazoline decarboxylase